MAGEQRPPVSESVYRRRRIAVLFLSLLVLALLVTVVILGIRLMSGPGDKDKAVQSPPATVTQIVTQAVTPSSTPSSAARVTTAPGCDPSKIQVQASVDGNTFPVGKTPVFSLIVQNAGQFACDVNVGTNQMEFLVYRDDEQVFSSKDCQQDAADLIKSIPRGGTEKANFTWQRNRTSPGCQSVNQDLPSGEYILEAKLGSKTSQRVPFTLTD